MSRFGFLQRERAAVSDAAARAEGAVDADLPDMQENVTPTVLEEAEVLSVRSAA